MKKGRNWYSIEAKSNENEVDIFIYDDIGLWGITAQDFIKELNNITADTIHAKYMCRGGDVFDGIAIFNAIKDHDSRVISHIDSLAASIASVMALAGDEVRMASNAFYMIHNPYSWAAGDANEMRRTATMLDKITDTLVKVYTNKTGKSADEVKELMNDTSWFSAEEAKEAGFVDMITDEEEVEAGYDLSVFNNVPQQVLNTLNDTKPSSRKLEHALREVGGLSKTDAKAVVSKGYKALDHRDDGKGKDHRDDDNKIKNKTQEGSMDKIEFKEKHIDTFNAVVADARKGLLTEEAVKKRVQAAITAESGRIIALDKLSADMPGHEEMIAGFKGDKDITAENAALQIVAAYGEKLKGIKAQQVSDADGLEKVPGVDGGDGGEGKKDFVALVADYQTEHKCKKGVAIKAIARTHKPEHAAYVKAQNKEVDDV